MTTSRHNPDLDSAFDPGPDPKHPRRHVIGKRDRLRGRAFHVMALIADLSAADRARVLALAGKMNRI